MSTRIEPAHAPYPPHVQQAFDRIMPSGVPPLTLFRTVARDARLLERFFGGALLDRGHLTLRQRELVILRVCANNASEYEWGVHVSAFASKAGLSEEHVAATRHAATESACWSDADRLLLRLCDALHPSCDIPEALWEDLRASFSEEAILELLMLNGLYKMVSILTVGLRMPLEPWAARFPAGR
jgi:alkylhydroperoxidase family enzyme